MLERLRSIGRTPQRAGLDLLLVVCPPWDITRPPINLAYLSTFMRTHGYQVDAWDLNIKFYNAVLESPLKDLWEMMSQNTVTPQEMTDRFFAQEEALVDSFVDRILDSGARFVGFSVHYRNVIFTERMVKKLRERDKKRIILYGGPEIAAAFKINTLPGLSADAYVVGEGELTLLELMDTYREKKKLVPLPGMMLPRGKELTEFVPRPLIADLDTLPFPTYEEFELHEYHPETNNVNLPFLFSRGCIGKCTFCMDHYILGKHRVRSAENAVAEMKHHIQRYGITHFGFNDLICNGSPKNLERLCDLIVEENLNILWWSYAVVRRGLTAQLFRKMRASGCVSLNFGMESASDKVLKLMNKYFNQEIAEETVRNCARAGIQTSINVIVGFPGETRTEHQETLDFLKRNRDYIHSVVNVGTLMLSPGTYLSMHPEEFGIKIDHERGTWYTDDGNTIDERNRRLEEVRQLLFQLNLPLVIVNRELIAGECEPVEDMVVLPTPVIEPRVRVADVRFFNGMDEEADAFNTGDLMTIAIGFKVDKPVAGPVLRVQLFNRDNPAGDNVFVFGTNTDRFHLDLGNLAPGPGEARLTFYRLNVLPGVYRLTIGIWPDEMAAAPYDVRHGEWAFTVLGEPDPWGATAHIPALWIQREPLGPSASGRPVVETVVVVDKDGNAKPRFMSQEQVRVRIAYDAAAPDGLTLAATIRLRGGVVHRALREGPLPAGRHIVEIAYQPVNLLEGAYEAEVSLVERASGKEVATRREPFDVRSRRIEGAGLVFNPCAWSLTKLPR